MRLNAVAVRSFGLISYGCNIGFYLLRFSAALLFVAVFFFSLFSILFYLFYRSVSVSNQLKCQHSSLWICLECKYLTKQINKQKNRELATFGHLADLLCLCLFFIAFSDSTAKSKATFNNNDNKYLLRFILSWLKNQCTKSRFRKS